MRWFIGIILVLFVLNTAKSNDDLGARVAYLEKYAVLIGDSCEIDGGRIQC